MAQEASTVVDNPISLDVSIGSSRSIESVRVRFGPHHVVEINKDGEATTFALVATHHGIRADASNPGGELEQRLDELRPAHPALAVD